MATSADQGARREDPTLERYRKAVGDLSQQLDWAIGYLHGSGKTEVAIVLAKNRSYIKRQILEEDTEPLATEAVAD